MFGYLHKDCPKDKAVLDSLFRDATIFCMPSYWESTGIVYMEAALWGLPVVSLKGQGREEIFPPSMTIYVEPPTAQKLAEVVIDLMRSKDKMAQMGRCGRQLVLRKYTWKKVGQELYNDIRQMVS